MGLGAATAGVAVWRWSHGAPFAGRRPALAPMTDVAPDAFQQAVGGASLGGSATWTGAPYVNGAVDGYRPPDSDPPADAEANGYQSGTNRGGERVRRPWRTVTPSESELVRLEGVEPPTFRSGAERSVR